MLFASCACAQDRDAEAWFRQGIQLELDGKGSVAEAFALYRRAAEAGLPEAQFNVATMLDSGRGTARDLAQAATWYARAAARGNRRAAYNMGQLYEAGQGVPQNGDAAKAWYRASQLPAAASRISGARVQHPGDSGSQPPRCVFPAEGDRIPASHSVELVWTSPQQSEPLRYFVELRSVHASRTDEVFTGDTDTTSLLPSSSPPVGDYMWRVVAISRRAGTYSAADWSHFSIVAD